MIHPFSRKIQRRPDGRRFIPLRVLVFRMGGVAGATRRIIRQRSGLFDSSDIRGELAEHYPQLEPAQHQLQDILDRFERLRVVECVLADGHSKIYKQAPRQLYLNL